MTDSNPAKIDPNPDDSPDDFVKAFFDSDGPKPADVQTAITVINQAIRESDLQPADRKRAIHHLDALKILNLP